ncbi:MAG TPA: leucine-rich repeat domain-containing protein, partial [Erysipelotrichaceae bacterium]|nr:leucine-rich repeat domain-containing protein [Erysipelotrichaceae bacterium]
MKKLFKLLLVLILMALMVFLSIRHIGTRYITSGQFEYKINDDNTITLVKYNKLSEAECITIPFSIDGYTVTAIASNAVDCINSEEIIIADSIIAINKEAFKNCEQVNKLTVPSHLTDSEGFCNLLSVNILTITYGQNGFMTDFNSNEERIWNSSSKEIIKLVISDDVRYLSNNAFRDLVNLEIIDFSESIESIGEYCFYNTYSLKSFILPLSLKSIKKQAFDMEEPKDIETVVL